MRVDGCEIERDPERRSRNGGGVIQYVFSRHGLNRRVCLFSAGRLGVGELTSPFRAKHTPECRALRRCARGVVEEKMVGVSMDCVRQEARRRVWSQARLVLVSCDVSF